MLEQKCEISSNFVPYVKQIIWRWLVGMDQQEKERKKTDRDYRAGCIMINRLLIRFDYQ